MPINPILNEKTHRRKKQLEQGLFFEIKIYVSILRTLVDGFKFRTTI
jgi:hypothetical protein